MSRRSPIKRAHCKATSLKILALLTTVFLGGCDPIGFFASELNQKNEPADPAQPPPPPPLEAVNPLDPDSPPSYSYVPEFQPPVPIPDPDYVDSLTEAAAPSPYPWPPERPSTQESLTYLFAERGRKGSAVEGVTSHARRLSLSDVAEVLASAADRAGYADRSFYSAPNGFVLATRLEATTADGRPMEGLKRYIIPIAGSASVEQAVTNLSSSMLPGNFRYIAFVVTDQPITYSHQQLPSAVTNRALSGATALNETFRDRPFTNEHKVLALIYEFTAVGEPVDNIQLRRPSLLSGADHIAAAGLGAWLKVMAAYAPG